MTCNPRWVEITEALLPGQSASDRPDIVNRVFKEKLGAMLAGLKSGLFFGGEHPLPFAPKSPLRRISSTTVFMSSMGR